ncbi:hypothetical protein ACHAPI_012163 [Fusarium lateritium]
MNKLFAGGKSSVIEMVESLIASEWFKPQGDEFWVTAGLTRSSLGVFAIAVGQVPSMASTFKIAHVEMGILATINFAKSVAQVEAQLASSFLILDPSFHLDET